MGKSAEMHWIQCDGLPEKIGAMYSSSIIEWVGRKKSRRIKGFLMSSMSLSEIVHEINECEVVAILRKFGISNIRLKLGLPAHGRPKRTVLRQARRNFPDVFRGAALTTKDEIYLSHILSPYGLACSLMPRRAYRLKWGHRKKKMRARKRGPEAR
jgi:hypothetical protein